MKKIFLLLAIAAISMTSCKKQELEPEPFNLKAQCESCVIVFYGKPNQSEIFYFNEESKEIMFAYFQVKRIRIVSSGKWKVSWGGMTYDGECPTDIDFNIYR